MTFDLVTDWINWKQWSEVGGYSWYHLVFIYRTTFLCVAIVGTVLNATETFTIVVKLFRVQNEETNDIENPSFEGHVFPYEIRGFCEQEEMDGTEQMKKFEETERSIIKIREEQEKKLDDGNKSSPGHVGEDSEEQEQELDQEKKSASGSVGEDSEEQEQELDQEKKSASGRVGEDSEEQEEELDQEKKSASGKLREDSEEQEEELDQEKKSASGKLREDSEGQYKDRGEKYIYIIAVLLLFLTGLFEDFPVVIVTFYTAALPTCGTPARQEVGSVLTMITITSAVMNSLWTMSILLCELRKLNTKFSYRCRPSKHYCKGNLINFGKTLLFIFIFLLFTSNFVMGVLTILQITGLVSMRPIRVESPLYLTHSVPVGPWGPGLDSKRDEAMFIYIAMNLQFPHQVVLYDNEGNVKARSTWTNQILNRLYIGQFEELSHLKDGTLTKAIPCIRAFPSVEWQSHINISNCNLIFNIKYYPTNNDWNPFKELWHEFNTSITVEWGIYLSNDKFCYPDAPVLTAYRINNVDALTSGVKEDLIKYTCLSACGDDANICDNAHHATFQSSRERSNAHVPVGLYLAINDLKVADSCIFNTSFEYSPKFCGESWSDVQTVDVPQEIQDTYPQFITIPEIYRLDEKYVFLVPKNVCNEMWDSSRSCCAYSEYWYILNTS